MCDQHSDCQNGGLCRPRSSRKYYCDCPHGFGGDRCEMPYIDCTDYDLGSHKWYCYNGGKCHSGVELQGFCNCNTPAATNWTGRYCQTNVNDNALKNSEEEDSGGGGGISSTTKNAVLYLVIVVVGAVVLTLVIDRLLMGRLLVWCRRKKHSQNEEQQAAQEVETHAWETESGNAVSVN